MTRLVAALLLVATFQACSKPLSVEQQVIASIRQMEEKIESGERRSFMAHIDENFTAQDGRMNRDQVRALVVFQLQRYERLQAQLFPITVLETGADSARAEFRALITGGPGWIPDSGQVYDFQTEWIFDGDEWLLQRASWEPVPLDEVLENLPMPDAGG